MNNLKPLLEPFQLNSEIRLKNRIVMAPMTRNMANNDLSPTQDMATYYQRRANAGLIITEGTIIRPDGRGYSNVPAIYTKEHIRGWQKVTDAVHSRAGHIFLQIWHVGRVSHPYYLDGELPVSASATTMTGKLRRSEDLSYGKTRQLELSEMPALITSFATAAANAINAGFDGVEIHGANGYLIDQFLHYHTNQRTDKYGTSPENMARFALEVVKACGERIGYQRVGIRLSPGGYLNEIIGDPRDAEVFAYLLEQLNQLPIAYVHTGNFDDTVKFPELGDKTMTQFIRQHYHGTLIACGGYNPAEVATNLSESDYDLVAIGRPFIANPDLIEKLQKNESIRSYEANMLETLY